MSLTLYYVRIQNSLIRNQLNNVSLSIDYVDRIVRTHQILKSMSNVLTEGLYNTVKCEGASQRILTSTRVRKENNSRCKN